MALPAASLTLALPPIVLEQTGAWTANRIPQLFSLAVPRIAWRPFLMIHNDLVTAFHLTCVRRSAVCRFVNAFVNAAGRRDAEGNRGSGSVNDRSLQPSRVCTTCLVQVGL
jgi:hypothetical protein